MSKHHAYHQYSVHNTIQFVKGGTEYFDLLRKLVQHAREKIYIRIYIWDDDFTGTTIANLLIEAAKRGVQVYIIADGYASGGLSTAFRRKIKAAHIHFKYFEPLWRCSHFYFGRRMHEKVVAIDGTDALVGGINFADRYNDVDGTSAWLDYAIHVEGDAAKQLLNYCAEEWDGSKPSAEITAQPNEKKTTSVRISRNDWVKGKHQVWRTYFNLFNHAEESITIICSYFLPGNVLRNKLSKAAKRGVKVKVILAGPSDVMIAKHAERYLYSWMLKNGIEIYEYQPTVLHAKMMVVDQHWVTIGSFNVNNVSAYASTELNLDIRNKPFARKIYETLDEIIRRDCVQVTAKNFISNATFFKRMLQKSCYEFIRVVLNLSTFYFKHE